MSHEEWQHPGDGAARPEGGKPDTGRASMTLLRVTQTNQAPLSAMADQQANTVRGASVLGLTMFRSRLQGAGLTPSLGVLALGSAGVEFALGG